jgi:hypothetical protein
MFATILLSEAASSGIMFWLSAGHAFLSACDPQPFPSEGIPETQECVTAEDFQVKNNPHQKEEDVMKTKMSLWIGLGEPLLQQS